MRTIGIYYAFWSHERDADFIPLVSKVKRLGFDQLEVHSAVLPEKGEEYQRRLKGEAEDEGIIISYGLGMSADKELSSPDERTRLSGVRYMKESPKRIGRMDGMERRPRGEIRKSLEYISFAGAIVEESFRADRLDGISPYRKIPELNMPATIQISYMRKVLIN